MSTSRRPQTAKEIRQSFKDFFAGKQHRIIASAPMVVKDDPTLMFTNAGMNRFKDIILGNVAAKDRRVADSQKCLRVSGKHNDLEEVGRDTYHHTMFEMLGNWSFGDYFKAEAIDWAWEYLVDVLGLDPDRLYATVFEGSAADGLGRDDEAAAIWERHLPLSHIINGNRHDNFWEMGDTGPCGPCSEIHIDLRPQEERERVDGATLVNADNPLVIEIWNLVFMQYQRHADGHLSPLPERVIDTGMGFERLCMALQGKTSNYDTDVFTPLLERLAEITGIAYGTDPQSDIAMRVVADHIRTIAFAIADGQLPSNAKAGYVIRRILRRAVRYGYTFLGQRQAFMHRLVDTLIASMGDAYPELAAQRDLITRVTREEEEAFLRTLDKGIAMLDSAVAAARQRGESSIPGRDVFTMYDTYGFPVDLTELILGEAGMTYDRAGFDAEMAAQKARARNAAAVETDDWVVLAEGEPRFVGYDADSADTRILRYRRVKQKKGEYYQLILAESPFYAEMGGQVGDRGTLTDAEGRVTAIYNTKRENGVAVHLVKQLPADPAATFTAAIDVDARRATSANHTATHLLHEALREVLGTHVEQKGSLVSPDMLRFDFSHFQKVTPEELRRVEHLANSRVRQAIARGEHRDIPIDEARAMGAMALFGEKYGDRVRVIQYGSSVELCGGTHVDNTGNIGMIRIISESSIAAGVRRIEAITGEKLEQSIDDMADLLRSLGAMLGNAPDLRGALQRAIDDNDRLKHEVEEYFRERVSTLAERALAEARHTEGGTTVVELTGTRVPDMVKAVAFAVRALSPTATAFLAATVDGAGKPLLTALYTDDLVAAGMNAATTVRNAAKAIKGGGGGQAAFAQAGGKDASALGQALDLMRAAVG